MCHVATSYTVQLQSGGCSLAVAKTASETGGGLHRQAIRFTCTSGTLRRSSASFTAVSFNTKVSSRESASVFRKTRPQTEGKPLSLCIKRKKQWTSRTLLKNVQRQLKKVPDYDIVLPHNPLQHEVLEAMKRFFQNRQYDVLVSLRQLLLTAAVLCLFCIPCFAGEWSVSLGMNGGDADTITGDLSLRYTLNPFYGNDMLEIRPLIECAGVYWKRDHDAIWGGGIAGGAVVDFWREENRPRQWKMRKTQKKRCKNRKNQKRNVDKKGNGAAGCAVPFPFKNTDYRFKAISPDLIRFALRNTSEKNKVITAGSTKWSRMILMMTSFGSS